VPSWERAVPLADLSGRDSVRAVCGGVAVCLALADGAPAAVRDVCAHRETALSGGIVRDGILTCPGHFWRYDLRTGQCLGRPDQVPSYPCRVTGGWVEVLIPDPAPALSMRQMLLAAAREHDAAQIR
jgi:nitrite reductase (NADH) small subunit